MSGTLTSLFLLVKDRQLVDQRVNLFALNAISCMNFLDCALKFHAFIFLVLQFYVELLADFKCFQHSLLGEKGHTLQLFGQVSVSDPPILNAPNVVHLLFA